MAFTVREQRMNLAMFVNGKCASTDTNVEVPPASDRAWKLE
jgi:hypothetical protein